MLADTSFMSQDTLPRAGTSGLSLGLGATRNLFRRLLGNNQRETLMGKFERHIFVCLNEREEKACCAKSGAEAVFNKLKDELRARGLSGRLRANRAGCLDVCAHGAALVVYPDNIWYGKVQVSDVPEVIEQHLIRGIPVRRLMISERELRNPTG